MRVKIRLDTFTDVNEFVAIASNIKEHVYLEDNANHKVDGKSLLGCLYSLEFNELYCSCETDISSKISKFLVY